jgi:hypothetical protein
MPSSRMCHAGSAACDNQEPPGGQGGRPVSGAASKCKQVSGVTRAWSQAGPSGPCRFAPAATKVPVSRCQQGPHCLYMVPTGQAERTWAPAWAVGCGQRMSCSLLATCHHRCTQSVAMVPLRPALAWPLQQSGRNVADGAGADVCLSTQPRPHSRHDNNHNHNHDHTTTTSSTSRSHTSLN